MTTLLSPQMSIPAIPVSAAVTAGVSIVYSYFVWKNDPMRSGG